MCDAMNVIDKLNEEFDEVQNKNIELEKQLREKDRQLELYKSEIYFRRLQSDFQEKSLDIHTIEIFIDNNLQFIKDNNILDKDDLEEYESHYEIIQEIEDPEPYWYDNIQGLVDEFIPVLHNWFTCEAKKFDTDEKFAPMVMKTELRKFKQEAEKFDKVIDDWEEFWQRPENKHHCDSFTHSPTREYLDDYDIDPTYINGTYEITIIKLQEWYDQEVEKVEKLEQENEELQNKILLLESSDHEE